MKPPCGSGLTPSLRQALLSRVFASANSRTQWPLGLLQGRGAGARIRRVSQVQGRHADARGSAQEGDPGICQADGRSSQFLSSSDFSHLLIAEQEMEKLLHAQTKKRRLMKSKQRKEENEVKVRSLRESSTMELNHQEEWRKIGAPTTSLRSITCK